MALKRLGTNANNSLYAIVFAPPVGVGEAAAASILAPADLAAIAQSIVSDKNFAATNPKGILGTGTTHSNATLDTLAYTAGAGLAAINVGMLVLGAGILPGTIGIAKPTPTSVTLSQAATASAGGVRVAFVKHLTPGLSFYGALELPGGRGSITVLPGDVVAIDKTGWPIVVSAAAIAYAGSLYTLG